jgi:hypothetical protein
VVLTIPKRLRPYCLYRRALLGDLARLAARILTDGGFRPDGTFVRWPGWPAYDSAALSEAFRRAVLRLFVRRGFFDEDQAEGMLQWPHSGFHVHAGVGVSEDDRPFALRHGRCVAETAALAGRTARTAPGFAPASPQLAPEGPRLWTRSSSSSRSGDDALLRLVRQLDPRDPSASGGL